MPNGTCSSRILKANAALANGDLAQAVAAFAAVADRTARRHPSSTIAARAPRLWA